MATVRLYPPSPTVTGLSEDTALSSKTKFTHCTAPSSRRPSQADLESIKNTDDSQRYDVDDIDKESISVNSCLSRDSDEKEIDGYLSDDGSAESDHEEKISEVTKAKQLIYIAPNEMARLSGEMVHQAGLVAKLEGDNLGIIITDEKNTISMAILDPLSSFERVVEEAKLIDGIVKVYLIALQNDNIENFFTTYFPIISETFVKNGISFTFIVYATNTGYVMYNQFSITSPSDEEVLQITPLGRALKSDISQNSLHDFYVSEGPHNMISRKLERYLVRATHFFLMDPALVFDNQWTGQYSPTPLATMKLIQRSCFWVVKKQDDSLQECVARNVISANALYISDLTYSMKDFVDVVPRSPFNHVFNFFSRSFPAKPIELIASYVESEEETALRTVDVAVRMRLAGKL